MVPRASAPAPALIITLLRLFLRGGVLWTNNIKGQWLTTPRAEGVEQIGLSLDAFLIQGAYLPGNLSIRRVMRLVLYKQRPTCTSLLSSRMVPNSLHMTSSKISSISSGSMLLPSTGAKVC